MTNRTAVIESLKGQYRSLSNNAPSLADRNAYEAWLVIITNVSKLLHSLLKEEAEENHG